VFAYRVYNTLTGISITSEEFISVEMIQLNKTWLDGNLNSENNYT